MGDSPTRLVDTRATEGAFPRGRLRSGEDLTFNLTTASAVSLNLTAVDPTGAGWLSVYPCATGFSGTSNLNFTVGDVIANLAITETDADGKICVLASVAGNGTVDVVVDATGGFNPAAGFTPRDPDRFYDSRQGDAPLVAGGVHRLTGLPSGRAAVLNLTVTGATKAGHLTAYPCADGRPTASVNNYGVGDTRAAMAIVPVDSDGAVCVYAFGSTDLVVDLFGYIGDEVRALSDGSTKVYAQSEFAVPERLLDTRTNGQGKGTDFELALPTANGRAVVLNVTATEPDGPGHVTAYPCERGRPTASMLNDEAGATVPNAIVLQPDSAGKVCFFSHARTHLVVDSMGYVNLPASARITGW